MKKKLRRCRTQRRSLLPSLSALFLVSRFRLAAAPGVLGLLRLLRFLRLVTALVPLGSGFLAIFPAVGARQPLALFALQFAHLQVHGLRELAPALLLRALGEHGAQRGPELVRRRIGDALLLELGSRQEQ